MDVTVVPVVFVDEPVVCEVVVFEVAVSGHEQGHCSCASGSEQITPNEQNAGSHPEKVVVISVVDVMAHVQGHSSTLPGTSQSIM